MFIWTPTEDRFDAISMQLENLAQEWMKRTIHFLTEDLTSIAIMKATSKRKGY